MGTPEVSAAASVAVQVQLAFAFELRIMQARCGCSGPGSSMVYWCIGVLVYGLCSALLAAAGETVWSVAIRGRYGDGLVLGLARLGIAQLLPHHSR